MTTYPYVRVDFAHRILSVVLNDGRVEWTDQLDDAHLVDMSADGQVVGIEILTPDNLKIEEMAERFDFRDQVPAIQAAIQSVMAPTASSFGRPMEIKGVRVSALPAEAETETPKHPPVVPPIEA
jgi:uncharacterized protein YuzE